MVGVILQIVQHGKCVDRIGGGPDEVLEKGAEIGLRGYAKFGYCLSSVLENRAKTNHTGQIL
jgi:hypothetical protein